MRRAATSTRRVRCCRPVRVQGSSHAHRHHRRQRTGRQRAGRTPGERRLRSRSSAPDRSTARWRARRVRRAVARPRRAARATATTPTAADCDIVVIATPWDSAATDRPGECRRTSTARSSSHGQRPGAGRQGVPAAGAAAWQCRCARAGGRAREPRRRGVPPPAGDRTRPHRRADRLRRADLRRRPGGGPRR